MNAFTFIPRKKHENPPNKLIVTKFIRQKKAPKTKLQTHKNIYDHIW